MADGLGSSAHLLAEGCLPAVAVAVTAVLAGAVAWLLLPQERSLAYLVGLLSATQLLAHAVLEGACQGATRTSGPPPVPSGGLLLLGHALAVLIAAGLLRRGEALLWHESRARQAAQVLDAGLRVLLASCLPSRVVAHPALLADLSPVLAHVVPGTPAALLPGSSCSRRGPPGR